MVRTDAKMRCRQQVPEPLRSAASLFIVVQQKFQSCMRAPGVLASGFQEREPGTWRQVCQECFTQPTSRQVLHGGNLPTTSPPRKCFTGSSMESKWISKRDSFCAEAFGAEICGWIHKSSILSTSRADASERTKISPRVASSSSPDQVPLLYCIYCR